MKNIGSKTQYNIYLTMQNPDPNRLPVIYEEWERIAREKLDDGPYYYIAGGAGGHRTMEANIDAFDKWKIMPKMLRNVKERNLSIKMFEQDFLSPIFIAPIGVQSIIHPDGEIASAKAAAKLGIPYITSSASTIPMEEIAKVMGNSPRWFQLYWSKDYDVTASFLKRAEKSGHTAIVVTLDTPMMAWREYDLKNVYLPFLIGEGVGNYFTDSTFLKKLDQSPEEDPTAAILHWANIFGNPGLTWDDLAFIRKNTNLPIILKGIMHPEDAKKALEYDVDGIIVSNHGGRQVDGSLSALDALSHISDIIQDKIPLLMDSGIRRGSDIIKAMALGAKGVLIGRPYAYGLAVAGESGVKTVLQHLLADLDLTLGLSGINNVQHLDKSILMKA